MDYKLVLGLEIHIHVKTEQKMFCGCSANIYGEEPNTHTCPTCLGLPGALPVPNYDSIVKTQLLGLALGCTLNEDSRFDRKHYFYPDLPKGYQISQYLQPLCVGGSLKLDSGKVGELERIHLEEDTAKSFHQHNETLIDFNKSGMSLIEIVTKPCFNNVEDAVDFCKKIQDLIIYLGVGDGDMEKGQMRLEANISLRTAEMEKNNELMPYKVEVKNINSFKFMEKAVKYEIKRQTELMQKGEKISQENRGWDESKGATVSQRDKEEAHDYRYFPEPDIPPLHFTKEHIKTLQTKVPQLPWERREELITKDGVSLSIAATLSSAQNIELYKKYKTIVSLGVDTVTAANWLTNKLEIRNLEPAEIVNKIRESKVMSVETNELDIFIKDVIAENVEVVAQIKSGKEAALEFLVGQVMRKAKGKAEANMVRSKLKEQIGL